MPTLAYPIRDSLYLNITDRCTLRCQFCPKSQDQWGVKDHDLTLASLPDVSEVVEAIEAAGGVGPYDEVVFCGFGEPTLRLSVLLAVAFWVKGQGGRVRLNTDGLGDLVHGRSIVPMLAQCVDRVSVSLNAQDEATYVRHCGPRLSGSYAAMLDFTARARAHFPEVVATAIDGLPGVDIDACRILAHSLGARFRPRALDVVG